MLGSGVSPAPTLLSVRTYVCAVPSIGWSFPEEVKRFARPERACPADPPVDNTGKQKFKFQTLEGLGSSYRCDAKSERGNNDAFLSL